MAKKGNSTKGRNAPAKKKASVKKAPSRGQASAAAPPAPAQAAHRAPLYLLVILALLAVIVMLANLFFFRDDSARRTAGEQREAHREKAVERPAEAGKEADRREVEAEKGQAESFVKVYLIRIDDRTERMSMYPVKRSVKGEPTVREALLELIKGPTAAEKRRGLLSAVPPGLRVRSVTVKNGVAEVDFNTAIEQNASGSVLIGRLDQIVYTATELAGVGSVVIKINGRHRQFIGSDGLSIGGPLQRRQ